MGVHDHGKPGDWDLAVKRRGDHVVMQPGHTLTCGNLILRYPHNSRDGSGPTEWRYATGDRVSFTGGDMSIGGSDQTRVPPRGP